MERWMARTLGIFVLACAGIAVDSPALACICVVPDLPKIVGAKGRVFANRSSGLEALPGATVQLGKDISKAYDALIARGLYKEASDFLQSDDPTRLLSVTTTDANGMFELATPPPGEYVITVSERGSRWSIPVRIKKGRPGTGGRLVISVDVNADCSCIHACVSKVDRSGNVEPKCLLQWKEDAP